MDFTRKQIKNSNTQRLIQLDLIRLIPETHGCLTFLKNVIHHLNRIKEKIHIIIYERIALIKFDIY